MIPEHLLRPNQLKPSRTMPASFFNDDEMRHFAYLRIRVELQSGRTGTLIRWATPKRPNTARIAFHSGNFLTVKRNQVIKIELPEQTKEQTNE